MIAANYRKFPEAMALQLVLVFGRPVWNTTRPSTRIGRALRQAQAAIVKATPQLVRWVKTATPQWFRDQVKRAKALAAQVLAALDSLVWELAEVSGAAEPLEGLPKLYADAKQCHREYSHKFCPITSVMEQPQWGPRFVHGRIGLIRRAYIDHYRETEF